MKEPVYFLKLQLKNIRSFGEKSELDLSDGEGNWKRWTIILGDNGTGKTTLLKIISLLEFELEKTLNNPKLLSTLKNNLLLQEIFFSKKDGKNKSIFVMLSTYLNNIIDRESNIISIIYNGNDGSSSSSAIENAKDLKIFGYGANRFMDKINPFQTGTFGPNSETLLNDDAKLINAEEWLLQLDYAASKESNIKEFAEKRRAQVKEILLDLLPDLKEIRFTTPTKDNLQSTVQFKTDYNTWVTIHQLSLGYKTMVAWTVDLAARMFQRYPDSDNPLAEPAIVLVDEIDLHLHPKWQRKIFDRLSELFPKTQFIVTAHSPLIVQSAPQDANIVLLRKEGNQVVIDNNIESVHNWRLDQIMSSDLFDINSSRGPETEKWLDERKLLLQKKELSQNEIQRLKELNERANNLPTADNPIDIEAMEIIRSAADYLKTQKA